MDHMIDIINPEINGYLESLLPERDPWFVEMEEMAEKEDFPAVGPQVGILLEILARSIGAKRIMELGSGFGYSGLWFSRALPGDGYILLTDFEDKNRRLAQQFFKKAGKEHLLEFKVGDALMLLDQEEGVFDIVFNDVDKEFYPRVIDPAYHLLRPGGLLISDNTLWRGQVAQKGKALDDTTAAVKEFNHCLKEHKGFLTSWLPVRDGVSMSIKL